MGLEATEGRGCRCRDLERDAGGPHGEKRSRVFYTQSRPVGVGEGRDLRVMLRCWAVRGLMTATAGDEKGGSQAEIPSR